MLGGNGSSEVRVWAMGLIRRGKYPRIGEIVEAVRRQVAHGRYPSDHLYGDGAAGPRMADILATTPLRVQKRLMY